LYGDEVMVSISPASKMPRPVSKFQLAVLTLPFAGPLKLSAQTCFNGGLRALAFLANPALAGRPAIQTSGKS
jgi:hypothetical protein